MARILAPTSKLTRLRERAEAAAAGTLGETLDARLDEERTRWHSRFFGAAGAVTDPIATETRHPKLLNAQPGAGS